MQIGRDDKPFKVESIVGRDYLDLERERPPRSSKLVVDVSWSWSPGNSRCDRYLICTDRHRTEWTLWTTWYNDERRREYHRVARGTPYRGFPAKYAAERLLMAAWRGELELWDTDLSGAYVDAEGLLTKGDVKRIEQEVFGGIRADDGQMHG